MSNIPKIQTVQAWIALIVQAASAAKNIIGSVDWQGRFRTKMVKFKDDTLTVNELQQEQIDGLTATVALQDERIAKLEQKVNELSK